MSATIAVTSPAIPGTINQTTIEPAAKNGRVPKVTGKLKVACDLMVWGQQDGDTIGLALDWLQAARAANYNSAAMRKAMNKPHVRRYLNEQRDVFRTSASAQNISYAVQVRAQADNRTAQMHAIRYLDDVDEEATRKHQGRITQPGVVIVLNAQRDARMVVDPGIIEVNPLNEHQPAGPADDELPD